MCMPTPEMAVSGNYVNHNGLSRAVAFNKAGGILGRLGTPYIEVLQIQAFVERCL
jgi:hypothetical protein